MKIELYWIHARCDVEIDGQTRRAYHRMSYAHDLIDYAEYHGAIVKHIKDGIEVLGGTSDFKNVAINAAGSSLLQNPSDLLWSNTWYVDLTTIDASEFVNTCRNLAEGQLGT